MMLDCPCGREWCKKNCNGLQHCYRLCCRANEVNTAAHNSDLSDILVYTNCLLSNLLLLCLVKRSAYPTLVSVCTHESLSYLSCEQAPVLQLLIASAPIISPEHVASIEMFFSKPSPRWRWHPDAAWLALGQRSLLLSICSRGILSWYFELRKGGVKTWNSTTWSSNRRRHLLL